jgi:hypothetical protein
MTGFVFHIVGEFIDLHLAIRFSHLLIGRVAPQGPRFSDFVGEVFHICAFTTLAAARSRPFI